MGTPLNTTPLNTRSEKSAAFEAGRSQAFFTQAGTLSEAMRSLREHGYTVDFNLQDDHLTCNSGARKFYADDFKVENVFRFDVSSDPGDQSVLYAITACDGEVKGLLVNGYGIYSESASNRILEKLDQHERIITTEGPEACR
jgi:hypothetical protein